MKIKSIALGLIFILILAGGIVSVQAGKSDNGDIVLSGPHKNINIISVPNPKNENFDGGNGVRLFVLMDITTKFFVGASNDTVIVDHDATDRKCGTEGTSGIVFPSEDNEWEGKIYERFLASKTSDVNWMRYYPGFYPYGIEYVYFYKGMLQMRVYL